MVCRTKQSYKAKEYPLKLLHAHVLCEDVKFCAAARLGSVKLRLCTGLKETLDSTSWAETGCSASSPMKKLLCCSLVEANTSKFNTENKGLESAALVVTPSLGSNL